MIPSQKIRLFSALKKVIAEKITIYHGSDKDFDTFDLSKIKKAEWGKGMYFSTDMGKDSAKDYGNIIYSSEIDLDDLVDITNYEQMKKIADYIGVELPIKNENFDHSNWKTYDYDFYKSLQSEMLNAGFSPNEITELYLAIKEKGYKGIYIPFRKWLVVFDPSRLKIHKKSLEKIQGFMLPKNASKNYLDGV